METRLHWISAAWKVLSSRLIPSMLVICLLTMTVYAASDAASTVNIHDEEATEPVITRTNKTVADDILAEAGIETEPADVVEFTGIEDGRGEITIDRAFKVSVIADGKTKSVALTKGSVADALKLAGIQLGPDDQMDREGDEVLSGGEVITIQRVVYTKTEVREAVPFLVEERETPVLKLGKSEVLRAGQDGISTRVYTTRTVDGVADEPVLTQEFVEREPIPEARIVGASVPVSDLDFEVEIVNNKPTEYARLFTGCRATGYSARKGAYGASGNHLFYGHVAVNPKVIPYNSKLYITSPDGKFVYGYAIASDTGIALMNGIIDVDLYYETFRESQLNGVRYVSIYVLNDNVSESASEDDAADNDAVEGASEDTAQS